MWAPQHPWVRGIGILPSKQHFWVRALHVGNTLDGKSIGIIQLILIYILSSTQLGEHLDTSNRILIFHKNPNILTPWYKKQWQSNGQFNFSMLQSWTVRTWSLVSQKLDTSLFRKCNDRYLQDIKTYVAKLINIWMEAHCLKLDLRWLERIVQRKTQRKLVGKTLIHGSFSTFDCANPCKNALTFRKSRYSKISSTHLKPADVGRTKVSNTTVTSLITRNAVTYSSLKSV